MIQHNMHAQILLTTEFTSSMWMFALVGTLIFTASALLLVQHNVKNGAIVLSLAGAIVVSTLIMTPSDKNAVPESENELASSYTAVIK